MKWYIISKKYVKYLHAFDRKVQNIEYGASNIKPYIGIILTINKLKYYVPISSPKPKHNAMKDSLDFVKIEDESNLYGVININNMIPVSDGAAELLLYDELEKFITFNTTKDKENYIKLLQKEIKIGNKKSNKIIQCTKKLHKICTSYPKCNFAKRACNFKLLEQACNEYTLNKTAEITPAPELDRKELAITNNLETDKNIRPSVKDKIAAKKAERTQQRSCTKEFNYTEPNEK